MVYAQTRIRPGKWDAQNSLRFLDTDNLIPARRPDLRIVNNNNNNKKKQKNKKQKQKKETCRIVEFAVPADHWMKIKENKKRDQYLGLTRELKKAMEHEGGGDTNFNWCTWNDPQRLRGVGNRRMSGDHLNYSIVEVGQNTEKSPGVLRRLAVSQTLVKDYQLTLV